MQEKLEKDIFLSFNRFFDRLKIEKNSFNKVLTSLCTKDKVVKFKQFAKCFQSRKGHKDYFL